MKYKRNDFAKKYGLIEGKHCVYGVFNGYYVHVKYTPIGNPRCLVTVVTDASEKQKKLEKYLEANKQKLNITNFGVVRIGLMVCPKFTGEVFARAEKILEQITAFLSKENFSGADICPYCGQPLEGKGILATESDIPFEVHERCFEGALAAARRKDAENAAVPDRKALGALGGLLGALFGAAVFVLTYAWWGFGALGAAVGVLAAYFVYRKFGGKSTLFFRRLLRGGGAVAVLGGIRVRDLYGRPFGRRFCRRAGKCVGGRRGDGLVHRKPRLHRAVYRGGYGV